MSDIAVYLCTCWLSSYARPWYAGALSDDAVWRLSVAYIGRKSRTERHRKTKIGIEVAHVICDSDTTFKIKRSKVKVTRPLCSPPCWRVRPVQRWAWERAGRGKLLLRCRLLGGARRFGAYGRGEGRGHIVAAARLQLAFIYLFLNFLLSFYTFPTMYCMYDFHDK